MTVLYSKKEDLPVDYLHMEYRRIRVTSDLWMKTY
jgi:hypothetical protein